MQAEIIWTDSTGRKVNFEAVKQQPDADGTRWPNGLSAEQLKALGYQELTVYEKPDDFSYETYYRNEQDFAPYVVYTRKSDEQLEELRKSKVKQQIELVEQSITPRRLREAVLTEAGRQWLADAEASIAALRAGL